MDNNNQQMIPQDPNQQVVPQAAPQQPVVYTQQPAQVQQYTAPQQPVVYAQQPVYVQAPAAPANPNKGKGLGMGIAGLVFGICSTVYNVIVLFYLAIFYLIAVDEAYYYGGGYTAFEVLASDGYLMAFIIFAVVGLIFVIPGMILSGIAKKYLKSGVTKAGFVLNLISLIFTVLLFVVSIAGTAMYIR